MSAPQRYRPKGPLPAFAWAGRPAPQAAAPAPDAPDIPAREPDNPYVRHYTQGRSFAGLSRQRGRFF